MRHLLASVFVVAVAGCHDRTEIVLVVDSDLAIPSELDRVDVTIEGPSSRTATGLALQSPAQLPLSLGVEAEGGASFVTVTATGSLLGTEVIRNAVRTEFVRGEIRSLTLLLLRSCLTVACGSDLVCRDGTCQSPEQAAGALLPWTGPPAKLDASGADSGPRLFAGGNATCVIDQTARLWCWGANESGQLGLGATGNVTIPMPLTALTDVVQWAAGPTHACARTRAGSVSCSGTNAEGELGDGTNTSSTVPVSVSGVADATDIAVGPNHACAVRATGAVVCWGKDAPGEVALPAPAAQVAAGDGFDCARLRAGGLACWGDNTSGQLGAGTTAATSAVPLPVAGINDATGVSLGAAFGCAVRRTGSIVCWGANDFGQLASDTLAHAIVPVEVAAIQQGVQLAAGARSACARESNGAVRCWGQNDYGNLGDGTTEDRSHPVPVHGTADFVDLAAGAAHACGVRRTGQIACWGSNAAGQLGLGGTDDRAEPSAVPDLGQQGGP